MIEHTEVVLRNSDNVLLDILNIETDSRGYLLTGNDYFLGTFNNAITTLHNHLEALLLLTNDNRSQQVRVNLLKNTADERLVLTKKLMDARKQGGMNEKSKIVTIEKGKIISDQIRYIINDINTEEFRLLKLRKLDNEKSNNYSEFIFLLLLVFIAIVFTLVFVIFKFQKNKNKVAEELKQSTGLFYNLFTFNPASITINRINNGKIINVNNSFLQLYGFASKEDVIGKTFAELNVFVDPNYEGDTIRQLQENKVVNELETNIQTRQGEMKWVSSSVLFLEVDNTPCLFSVSIDITKRKKAEEQLKAVNKEIEEFTFSQSKLSNYSLSLIEASLDPLVTINIDGKITDMNEALANITGMTREELTGTDFFDYFTEPQKAREVYQEVFAVGYVADSPLTLRHKNGKLTDVLFNGSVYKDDEGNVLGVVIVARDVTAQKLLSKYSLSLIEASLDPLITINTEGKITDMNEALVNITGMTREELTGTDFFMYFTEPQKAREVYQEVFAKGSVADSPLTLLHKDGKLTDVLFNGSVYKDDRGNVLGIVIVARDTTEQKIFEKELIEAKIFAELATDIAEQAKLTAENATRIAESAVKAKQQFLSNMSHEIRTPMNAIIGFTKVVLKTELSAKQKEYLTAIKMSGDALIVLINDILDLAKVDAGKMKFEQTPFRLESSISAMIHVFETKIQEKNLLLVKEYDNRIPLVLAGDPVRLHQIILNLVSNAVKFTSSGKITVSVRLLNEDEKQVTIEFAVTDTGIGIAANKIDHIFDNFQQATSETSRLYGGTGLGLAIAKQLVESQNGAIYVKSNLGEGSTFSFKLPFHKTKDETQLESEIIVSDLEIKNIRVLVAEDVALNQLLMKTLLDDFGFGHDIAGNGKIAIEKLKNKAYDIILMDLQMPEMNGFAATQYIRETMKSKIPIIALTADVTTVDLQKCKAVGMNDYISKPLDERLLYNKIIDLLKKPVIQETENIKDENIQTPQANNHKCIDLAYLNTRTKGNQELMNEMIAIYLEQTPPLLSQMKQSLSDEDWDSLYATVHKMIPSFFIMGINKDFENMAKKVQECTSTRGHLDEVPELVLQLDKVCSQACNELVEYILIKKTNG
jgi:PAS domain S-box-containing protein